MTIRRMQLANQRPDTPEDIRDRAARIEAGRLAQEDTRRRFPELTAENLEAALEYQDAAYDAHYTRICKTSQTPGLELTADQIPPADFRHLGNSDSESGS